MFCLFGSEQELAQKIKGYQEQIASLNSKCKMLTVKAKHATTLLSVSDAEGLTESLEELDGDAVKPKAQSQVSVRIITLNMNRSPGCYKKRQRSETRAQDCACALADLA